MVRLENLTTIEELPPPDMGFSKWQMF